MLNTYGVEAARTSIILEMKNVFGSYGLEIDYKHLSLIADYMTHSESQTSLDNEHIDINLDDTCVDASNENPNLVNLVGTLNDSHKDLATNVDTSVNLDDIINVNANNVSNDVPDATDGDDATNVDDVFNHFDIFDPRNWDALNSKMIDVLVA
ncbi:uncharacterized protein LOC112519960 [Cynara cardunculus var. scolymus]|uniref:uncharacterized protein LOC112519960 n=1 Tax=Cynara cardunculus var. scolymus TaxID=59895 RepID=UPI000D6276A3|nr:uncharacterized protein LOC112519960 [Cynara cardunculus var. scolymus]